MKPHWIVEENKFSSTDFDSLIDAIKSEGNSYSLVQIRPFIHDLVGKQPSLPTNTPIIAYGSIGIKKACELYNWIPGTFDSNSMNPETYIKYLNQMMLNHDTIIIPMNKVLNTINDYEFFIRPNTDNKEFAGTVIKLTDFKEWYEKLLASGYLEDINFDVAISSVKEIYKEYRLIVVNSEIVTGSQYRFSGYPQKIRGFPDPIKKCAEEAIKKFNPSLAYVVDVAWLYDDEYKIIEYNSFNSAGFYNSNNLEIIKAFNKYYQND